MKQNITIQINQKVELVKLDVNFLEASKPSGDNNVNVTQNSPEWFSKFDLIWEVVKEGKSDPDMTFIKKFLEDIIMNGKQ